MELIAIYYNVVFALRCVHSGTKTFPIWVFLFYGSVRSDLRWDRTFSHDYIMIRSPLQQTSFSRSLGSWQSYRHTVSKSSQHCAAQRKFFSDKNYWLTFTMAHSRSSNSVLCCRWLIALRAYMDSCSSHTWWALTAEICPASTGFFYNDNHWPLIGCELTRSSSKWRHQTHEIDGPVR